MKALFISEWKIILHNRAFWITLLSYTALCIATPFMVGTYWLHEGWGWREFFFELYDSGLWMIGAFFIGAFLMAREFSHRTVNHDIYAGYGRKKILLSRAIVFYSIVLLIVMILVMSTIIGTTTRIGWGTISMSYTVSACLAGLLFDMGISSVFFFFSYLFENTGIALASGALIAIILEQFTDNISRSSSGLVTYLPLIKAAFFRTEFSHGNVVPLNVLWMSTSVSLIIFAAFNGISYLIFCKRDLR